MCNKSALVKHVCLQDPHMDWNNSKILAKETNYIKRKFLYSRLLFVQIIMLLITKPFAFIQLLIRILN